MSTSDRNLSIYQPEDIPDGDGFRIGIVVAQWNRDITDQLLSACVETLAKHGVNDEDVKVAHVPGSFELPTGARIIDDRHDLDAVICLGCVIQGETSHNEYINQAVATGLVHLSIMRSKPFIFGVLTPDNQEQALDRAGGKHGNKGIEAAIAAIQMAAFKRNLDENQNKQIGF
ncbi:MAG: 6,7-dimethyl-8-ribityllumazine synthase [Saprospiraceae bacterium]|nr:6,7-dimethyl-8-ribityllumazine synthase [Saprospiraceae bacterium]